DLLPAVEPPGRVRESHRSIVGRLHLRPQPSARHSPGASVRSNKRRATRRAGADDHRIKKLPPNGEVPRRRDRLLCRRLLAPDAQYHPARHLPPFDRPVRLRDRLQGKPRLDLNARPLALERLVQCAGRGRLGLGWKVVTPEEHCPTAPAPPCTACTGGLAVRLSSRLSTA